MKQYMLSVPMIDGAPPRPPEEMQKAFAQMAVLNEEMQAAGAWVFGGGLLPASSATVVEADGDGFLVTDGPFTESKEHIGGFWVDCGGGSRCRPGLGQEGHRGLRRARRGTALPGGAPGVTSGVRRVSPRSSGSSARNTAGRCPS